MTIYKKSVAWRQLCTTFLIVVMILYPFVPTIALATNHVDDVVLDGVSTGDGENGGNTGSGGDGNENNDGSQGEALPIVSENLTEETGPEGPSGVVVVQVTKVREGLKVMKVHLQIMKMLPDNKSK